jgi:hypothetical protein
VSGLEYPNLGFRAEALADVRSSDLTHLEPLHLEQEIGSSETAALWAK